VALLFVATLLPTIDSNFTLRAARNTAVRGKGTIFPRASQLVAPHNQPLPMAGKRPVTAAESISSAVTLTARLLISAAHARGNKDSGVCYNKRMLQRRVFINKIRMIQRTRRNTIGRRSTRVRMTCRDFSLWLKRKSSSLLSFVRFSYQFSSVSCIFARLAVKISFLTCICLRAGGLIVKFPPTVEVITRMRNT